MNVKLILKATALLILVLESFWVFVLHNEPHALAVASGIASLFGINSAHEHFNDDDKGGHGI